MMKIWLAGLSLAAASLGLGQSGPPKCELRAAWIATVDNIDFPSKKGLPADSQRAEFQAMLDSLKALGMNAVIVQVRPAADAFYPSEKEPWSEWLTGVQGKAPEPYYDPLAFMIEAAHKRNLEFHAWLNPYRAVFDIDSSSIAPDHITRRKPEWFFQYGKKTYFNPGLPEVREYIVGIVADLALRYDIDAVHFDDYFYPYHIPDQPFQADTATFRTYSNGFASIDNWRRHNVDLLIEAVHLKLKAIKPKVKFGISPFAVWRNRKDDKKGSDTEAGQPTYDYLYADVRKWLQKGWIDYVAPQLYFAIGFKKVRYDVVLKWWSQNCFGRHLYIGQGAYRIGRDSLWKNPSEMPNQLRLNRKNPIVKGSIYFSAKSLLRNPLGIADTLKRSFYATPACVPPMRWKDAVPPNPPRNLVVTKADTTFMLSWEKPKPARDGDTATYFAVYRFSEKEKVKLSDPRRIVALLRDTVWHSTAQKSGVYAVTAFDRLHNESKPAVLLLK
ncbi:MAG: family 10 glycosylhydrolase [Chloroherpetonaceae bacterium]|nr:family 10 glycosylhydrolase [Chloroherpetonaceae bacterium]